MANPQFTSIPNLLTYGRIVAIPVIALLIASENLTLRLMALVLYVLAAITDWLDGYLARKWNQSSPLGRMLDPIADKLLVGILIVMLAWDGSFDGVDLIPACAILFREIFIAGLREFLGNAEVVLHVSKLAKWKTTAQLVALTGVLAEPALSGVGMISNGLLWIAAILTVYTGMQYFRASWPHLSGDAP